MTAHALYVMGMEFLYDLYVRRDPMLRGLTSKPEEVADFLSAFWYRAAVGEERAPHPAKARRVLHDPPRRRGTKVFSNPISAKER